MKLRTSNLSYVLFVCLCLTISACATVDKSKRLDLLDISLNDFRKALRWGYYEEAARYIQIKDYKRPLRNPDYLKSIRITSYEYGKKVLSEDKMKLEISSLINFYDVNHGIVSTVSENQIWWFDAEKKLWFLDGDIPNLTGSSNR